jgi:predicted phage-related endonuclease
MKIQTERKTGFSSSKILAVMGQNPFRSPYEQWLIDTKQMTPEFTESSMQKINMGHLMEPVIKKAVEARIGKELTLDKNRYMHDDYDFMTIEFDALDKEEGIVYEFKNTEHDEAHIRNMYYPQVQSAMAITGYNKARICFLRNGWNLQMIDIERDENFIEHMIKVGEYYITCVRDMMPPDEDYIAELVAPIEFFQTEEPEEIPDIDLDAEDRKLLIEWAETKTQLAELKQQESALRGHFADKYGRYADQYVTFTNKAYKRQGGFDMERLMYDYPDIDFEQYRKPGSSYQRQTVRIIGGKDIEI